MIANTRLLICDGYVLKSLAQSGLSWLEHNQERINQSNVFPVPDGDTGTNMYLTMRKAYAAIENINSRHVGYVSHALAQGALMGARGNSGVILSQLWRGFAEALEGRVAFDAPLFAHALRMAVDRAYRSVVDPVEGTILTVARESTEAVVAAAKNEKDLLILMQIMVEEAQASLARTPDLLPVLKKAGVVDSGGQGLMFMLEGMLLNLQGADISVIADVVSSDSRWEDALVPDDEAGYGYDVQFLMRGTDMDVDAVRKAIDDMGWSTLVVGDAQLIKVHVHVHDPGQPISYAIGLGATLDDIVVENMQQQYEAYVSARQQQEVHVHTSVEDVAVIAVANGDGLKQVFITEMQAAAIITGGQTMNPSTEDFLREIDALPNNEIILLPNNKNIILAAEQAASIAKGKRVRVVPSRSIPQGIAAMLAYVNIRETSGNVDEVAAAMRKSIDDIVTIEITTATRDTELDAVQITTGQFIGLVDGKLVAANDTIETVVRNALYDAGADERELITLYYGDGVDETQATALVELLTDDFAAQEFDIIPGGQPLYPYIISVE
ncbi:MAG: DAK2 domain-containing protein [Chloroflexi bacterium]|nr:MAG: DAK2 domain-containing protein [Chloroflexota bacterium]